VQAFPGGRGQLVGPVVEEAGRGRGRGTTAVLAAEEILRSWGCTRAEGSFLGEEGPAATRTLRWAESLGYVLAARNMVKDLPVSPPALPPGTEVRPMDPSEFPAWLAAQAEGYVQSLVFHSGFAPEQAAAKSAADHAAFLAQGLGTPDTEVRRLLVDGEVVGTVWINTAESPQRPAWVLDVEVEEAFRGRGHGRSLMLVAERVAVEAGLRRLGLNVHAGNVPAERLYASLGYRPFRWVLAKRL
jgi:GNAT superfamily N-acetyltransferase